MRKNNTFLLFCGALVLLLIGIIQVLITNQDPDKHMNERLIRQFDSIGEDFTDKFVREQERWDRFRDPEKYLIP
jgi:hypothetical protein